MAEDEHKATESRRFIGSRPWVRGRWDIEKPATSRPSRKD